MTNEIVDQLCEVIKALNKKDANICKIQHDLCRISRMMVDWEKEIEEMVCPDCGAILFTRRVHDDDYEEDYEEDPINNPYPYPLNGQVIR